MEWFVSEGKKISEMDKLCLVESDKAIVEITSRFTGVVRKTHFNVNDIVAIGSILVDIDEEGEEGKEGVNGEGEGEEDGEGYKSLREVLKVHGISYSELKSEFGGRKGRKGGISKEEISRFLEKKQEKGERGVEGEEKGVAFEDERLSGIRLSMAKKMIESARVPQFCLGDEYYAGNLVKCIRKLNMEIPGNSYQVKKISVTCLLIKILSISLLKHPQLNSKLFITGEGDNQVFHKRTYFHHHVSVAIQTDQGLVVPNIKDVHKKGVLEIQANLLELVEKAKNQKLSLSDIENGTISLSNVGMFGSGTYLNPVLFDGQAVIGAVGRIRSIQTSIDDNVSDGDKVLNISWSADHRIVDGYSIAVFSKTFKALVENPELVILY